MKAPQPVDEKFYPAHLIRQADIVPLDCLGQKITVIGAGAIGSWAVLSLAKLGFSDITVFDDDTIDMENMNCQFYRISDVGRPKIRALYDMVKDYTNVEIDARQERYLSGAFSGIVISAVDNMNTRRVIWENSKNSITHKIIDPRMGAESAMMFCMSPNDEKDIKAYEKTLYSDENAVQERCTAKATIYTANLLSGLVVKAVKNIAKGEKYPRNVHWAIDEDAFKAWHNE